jgi:hypothetical protein
MGNGSLKLGDAVADHSRDEMRQLERGFENAVQKLHIRAEMRSNPHEEEDTGVIERRLLERQTRSDPPSGYGKQAAGLIRSVKGWPQALFGLGLLALIAFGLWLKWR